VEEICNYVYGIIDNFIKDINFTVAEVTSIPLYQVEQLALTETIQEISQLSSLTPEVMNFF
jgi:hypothetical protein